MDKLDLVKTISEDAQTLLNIELNDFFGNVYIIDSANSNEVRLAQKKLFDIKEWAESVCRLPLDKMPESYLSPVQNLFANRLRRLESMQNENLTEDQISGFTTNLSTWTEELWQKTVPIFAYSSAVLGASSVNELVGNSNAMHELDTLLKTKQNEIEQLVEDVNRM